MLICWILVTVLLLILPAVSEYVKTTCDIPSVEAGDDATLTTYFDMNFTNEESEDFYVSHFGHNATESQAILRCTFSYGNVTCKNTSCCTWESHVTDVFRVYIHNVSQELEGRFWGFVSPANEREQKNCNFTLKASTCLTHVINASNSQMTCNNRSVTTDQTCNVTCIPGHYFQKNQTSVTYTCVGKNKWSPEISITSCEELAKSESANIYLLFLLITLVIPIVIVAIFLEKRYTQKKVKMKKRNGSNAGNEEERHLLTEGSPKDSQQLLISAENFWLHCIKMWYSEFHSKSHFFPPLHFNQETFTTKNIASKEMHVPEITQSISHLHYDRALQRVLHGMQTLADSGQEKEVMFVVSQLQFGNYLGEPTFAPAVALLPRPSTLPEDLRKQHFDKGDFDVLIIHSKHGLFTLQISSVGENFSQQTMTDQEEAAFIKKVGEITNHLNKAEVVLKHLTSDLEPEINITKCLVMPNITSGQLKRAIESNPSTGQFLCECFGAKNVVDAVKLCLLSDQLLNNHMPSDINHSTFQALRKWWQNVKTSRSGSSLTPSLYEQLVARFCGPATTVDVYCITAPRLNITLGEAVSETGERVARLVLFPQQVDILNQSPSRAFLSGPPGTGKTIVLIVQGLTWIQRGYDVHVVSTWNESRAATFVIEHQLQARAKAPTAMSLVKRHLFDLAEDEDGQLEIAVNCLKFLSKGKQMCVIADEAVPADSFFDRKPFTEFCDQLINEVSGVCIWGASVHHDVKPLCLDEVKLTAPLRFPPVVVREVREAHEIKKKQVYDYTVSVVPFPTDGPPVMRIEHRGGQSNHTWNIPINCVECGHQVALVLTKELKIGRTDDSIGPPPFQYRDVLVLCSSGRLTVDREDTNGRVTTMASGLVRGLSDYHVPVRVVEEGDETAIQNMALGVGDLVTVASWDVVRGLERKVVVLESGIFGEFDRLSAMSRCTSQLVLIDRFPVTSLQ